MGKNIKKRGKEYPYSLPRRTDVPVAKNTSTETVYSSGRTKIVRRVQLA
jgi:hypothetical protein